MKNSTKQILSFLLVLTLILSLSTLLSGCYAVKSGKMDKIEGTYKLTGYSGKTDYLTERGIELYVVIRSDGTGYYAYKSNDVEPYISEIRCSFTADPDDSGKYEYVSINFGNGNDAIKLAIVAAGLFEISTNLNSQTPVWGGNLIEGTAHIAYYTDVDFTRVSKATDLSHVNSEFGNYNVVPYGAMGYDGTYELLNTTNSANTPIDAEIPENPFIYCYFDMDVVAQKGKMWYMLKSDKVARTVDFSAAITTNYDSGFAFRFGSSDVRTEKIMSSVYVYIPYVTDVGEFALYFVLRGAMTEEDILANAQSQYEYYLSLNPKE